jgi:NitT/TauT family transport system substrate-binding protein
MHIMQSRRRFLTSLSLASAASLVGAPKSLHAEPPPETTRIRLVRVPGICQAPEYVAEALLHSEGFTEVQYVQKAGTADIPKALASGEADLNGHFAAPLLLHLEAGDPVVILAGLHIGCFVLFGTSEVRTIRDLRGKTVAVPALDSARYVFLASMVAYVGLDPQKDLNIVMHPGPKSIQLLAEGKIDAYLSFPPEPQEMREQQIGHEIINSTVDRPWSDYFCCMLAGNRDFVRDHPVATKRALRAILKAADVCAFEPEQSARLIVDQGYAKRYDYALQAIKEIPYGQWREHDAEDTLRFYALRLREVGMLKSSPQTLIAQGTDWRFINELKKELKG